MRVQALAAAVCLGFLVSGCSGRNCQDPLELLVCGVAGVGVGILEVATGVADSRSLPAPNTVEIDQLQDYDVCYFAISIRDGVAIWKRDAAWSYYVKEAKRRDLTPEKCAVEALVEADAETQFVIYKQNPPSKQSLRWLCLAGNKGHALAQEELGDLYVPGRKRDWETAELVGPNTITAYLWYSLAASNGLKRAASVRDRLSKYMNHQEITEAKRLIALWKPNPAECESVAA